MTYTLSGAGRKIPLPAEGSIIIGRVDGCDVTVSDPTVSRRHAEIRVDGPRVAVRDLGSSNGTFVNGGRVDTAMLTAGDTLAFGKVPFVLSSDESAATSTVSATVIRQRPIRVGERPYALAEAVGALEVSRSEEKSRPTGQFPLGRAESAAASKLSLLLEISKGLSRAVDVQAILQKITSFVFDILDVDRVVLLLSDEDTGALTPAISRDKRGGTTTASVPQSILRTATEQKVAILSDNAPEDARFGGQSIVMQQVRSAICTPLVGSEEKVLGAIYVDNLTTTHTFGDDDLELLVAFSGIAAVAIENSRFAERSRKEALIRSNFERYFAPSLAELVAKSPEAVKLGGSKKPVAILFSDIRGFTSLSEGMQPEEIARLLSEYFTEMVECVFKNGGTLDKFIGDAILAQWGAPISSNHDAERAVQTALDMRSALARLNTAWKAEGRPEVQIGIGLNYGEAFAGNIGSERRLEFTVIGDAVNTASRLCSNAKAGEILLSESMCQALTNPPNVVPCPPIPLKGKTHPVAVFKIVTGGDAG